MVDTPIHRAPGETGVRSVSLGTSVLHCYSRHLDPQNPISPGASWEAPKTLV
jgi:hypothetical protein